MVTRIPAESTQPQAQNDFMKKMSALTGLTGTALSFGIGYQPLDTQASRSRRIYLPPRLP
jgi:hypothetical protein